MSTDPAGHAFAFLLPTRNATAPVAGAGDAVGASDAAAAAVGQAWAGDIHILVQLDIHA